MSTSLYRATVPVFLQTLPCLAGLIEKAREHCAAKGLPDEALSEARLAPGMWPFAKQIMVACQHSAGAISGVQIGETGPDITPAPTSLAVLAQTVSEAISSLNSVAPEQINAIAAKDTCFRMGDHRMDFSVEDYLLSFALPNFYFHAGMAYAVLRNQGLEVGKRDFLGALRLKA